MRLLLIMELVKSIWICARLERLHFGLLIS
jgi:hypothetical protein